MTDSAPIEQPDDDGGNAAPVLDAIAHRYEEAKASIIDSSCSPVGDEPLPDTEAVDLRNLPPVPAEAPRVRFHGNVAAELPGIRRWWRGVRSGRHRGGAGRR